MQPVVAKRARSDDLGVADWTLMYGRPMLLASSVLAVAAALIHLVLFARANFRSGGRASGSDNIATQAATESRGFNGLDQSHIDLFLAVGVLVGVVLLNLGGGARLDIVNPNNYVEQNGAYGTAAITFGLLAMLAAAIARARVNSAPLQATTIRGLLPAAGLSTIILMKTDLAGI